MAAEQILSVHKAIAILEAVGASPGVMFTSEFLGRVGCAKTTWERRREARERDLIIGNEDLFDYGAPPLQRPGDPMGSIGIDSFTQGYHKVRRPEISRTFLDLAQRHQLSTRGRSTFTTMPP